MTNETWIPLLVDARDYAELTAIVAERASSRSDGHAKIDALEVTMPRPQITRELDEDETGEHLWSVTDLRKLIASGDRFDTAHRWAKALDVCAANVGEWLSTERICEESGMSLPEWRDATRKILRHRKVHYPDTHGSPLGGVWGPTFGRDGQIYWRISQAQADRWIEARNG